MSLPLTLEKVRALRDKARTELVTNAVEPIAALGRVLVALTDDWLRLDQENAKMRQTIIGEFETSKNTVDPVTLERTPR